MRLLPVFWVLLGLALVLLYLRLSQFHGFGPRGFDDQHYYAQARSLVLDRDLDLERELSVLTPRPDNLKADPSAASWHRTPIGRVPCKYPIGAPLLVAPFLAAGQGIALALAAVGVPVPTDGYSLPCYLAWGLGNLFWAFVALVAVCRILGAMLSPAAAFLVTATVFAASPLLHHTVGDPYMAHVPATALVCLLVLLVLRLQARPLDLRLQALAALIGGLAVATRSSEFPYLVVLAFPILGSGVPGARRLAAAAITGAGVLAGFLPQMFAWKAIYGSWIHYSYEGEAFRFPPFLIENLFGLRAGLFVWNPLWLPALLAFLWRPGPLAWYRLPVVAVALLNACWWCHWWGDTFGGRAYASLFPFVAVGAAFLVRALNRWSDARGARVRSAVAAGLVVTAILAVAWSLAMIARMELLRNEQRALGEGFPWPFR